MGLPGLSEPQYHEILKTGHFEPGSSGPKPERLAKLPHSPNNLFRINLLFLNVSLPIPREKPNYTDIL